MHVHRREKITAFLRDEHATLSRDRRAPDTIIEAFHFSYQDLAALYARGDYRARARAGAIIIKKWRESLDNGNAILLGDDVFSSRKHRVYIHGKCITLSRAALLDGRKPLECHPMQLAAHRMRRSRRGRIVSPSSGRESIFPVLRWKPEGLPPPPSGWKH